MDAYIVPSSISCGVFQLFYLDNSHSYLMERIYNFFIDAARKGTAQYKLLPTGAKDYQHPVWGDGAFLLFSDADLLGNGRSFADFLGKNNLAYVTNSKSTVNPNSGNHISVYIAQLNHEKIAEWYEANKGK